MIKKKIVILLWLCFLFSPLANAAGPYVWWEGETPKETNFPSKTWFSTGSIQGKETLLSGGNWLTNDGKRSGAEAFAIYEISVPGEGDYDFWVRKFWQHGPFRWRFDEQEWKTVGASVSLADSVEIVTNISANWVFAGKVKLSKGIHRFELRLLAKEGESLTACFDCFLLMQDPFVPHGKLKPGERSGLSDPGFFAWEPAYDSFDKEVFLDLRSLNEKTAGESGFIQRNGNQFALGNGKPVRFWGVNASSSIAGQNHDAIVHLAKLLAKRGVNIVRYHSPLFDSSDIMKVNPQTLDNLFFLISALKAEGIYITVSFYFPLWLDIKPEYGIPGYDTIKNKIPFSLLYFDSRMQEIYKSWAKAILTTVNPYTGQALGQEPAVGAIEVINEDSYFFWTFSKDNIPAVQMQKLEKQFGDWLITKYGTLDKALAAWSNTRETGDDTAAGRIKLYDAWSMTSGGIKQSSAAKVKRVGDQVHFLTDSQRGFYESTKTYFQKDLNIKNLVISSNWTVSDSFTLGALEKYTYMAGDAIDRHGYTGGEHTSKDGSSAYAVRTGHTFKNLGGVKSPGTLPLQFIKIEDYPHLISEIGWTNPDLYRADYSFLTSAYGSLQDIDAFFAFALGGTDWDASMNKFALSCPVILGNFPAYALLYRRGDIKPADPVIRQILNVNDLFAMKGSGDLSEQSLDDLRLKDVPPGSTVTGEVKNIDPLAFYVGRVNRTFTGNPKDSFEMNLSKYINKDKKTVSSLTGELLWDYGNGIAAMNTPKSQGAAGFLSKQPKIDLADISIECKNEYATVVAVSLDDQPIKDSNKILVQVMTVERPFGFKASNGKDGEILNMGTYPFGLEKINASLTLRLTEGPTPKIIPLDENGYAVERNLQQSGGMNSQPLQFKLADDVVYYSIQRDRSTAIGAPQSKW